eukprot:scaffold3808_cov112-Isochrysis_galbana.AAC.4
MRLAYGPPAVRPLWRLNPSNLERAWPPLARQRTAARQARPATRRAWASPRWGVRASSRSATKSQARRARSAEPWATCARGWGSSVAATSAGAQQGAVRVLAPPRRPQACPRTTPARVRARNPGYRIALPPQPPPPPARGLRLGPEPPEPARQRPPAGAFSSGAAV